MFDVHQPACLMAAADVELVVSNVSARDVVGNHGQAVGAVGARSALDIEAAHESCGRSGIGRGHLGRARDSDVGVRGCDLQEKVNDRHRSRDDRDVL